MKKNFYVPVIIGQKAHLPVEAETKEEALKLAKSNETNLGIADYQLIMLIDPENDVVASFKVATDVDEVFEEDEYEDWADWCE